MSPYKINTPIILSIFGSICSGIVGGLTSRILPPSLMSLRNLSTDSNFSMIIILSVVFLKSENTTDNSSIISSLGAFLYGSQRLLPLAQTTYRSLSTVRSSTFSVRDIIKYIELKNILKREIYSEISFSKNIVLKSVGFTYPKSRKGILKNCNLEINKGEIICILGTSGSGKSTLMDILMGLINPTKGNLYIKLNYRIPKELTKEQKELIKQIKDKG